MIELVDRAVRTGKPLIELGSQRRFMTDMNLSPTGGDNGNMRPFAKMFDRLLDSSIAVVPFGNPNVSAPATVRITDSYQLWLSRGGKRPTGFREYVKLSEPFFEQVVKFHVDLDKTVLKKLGGKALQLDLYGWLVYELAGREEPEWFTWDRLRPMFGLQLADTKDGRSQFKRLIRRALNGVLALLPDDVKKNVTIDTNLGICIAPTPRMLVPGVSFAVTPQQLALPALTLAA
jgi:hypothetical protein